MNREPEFFVETERLARESYVFRDEQKRAAAGSGLLHAFILALMILGPIASWMGSTDDFAIQGPRIRFYEPGGEGEGGGGGGGGSGGERPTAYIPVMMRAEAEPEPEPEVVEPRRAPIAPRKPRPLNFNDLDVPDLPNESAMYFGAFSPDATEFPGLSLTDGRDYGGVDRAPSSGSGGGIGGGEGTGVGTGEGWGVGPGRGGGSGGGDYRPGGWDIEPIPIYKPEAVYPAIAKEKMVSGEVILQVRVREDGSTEVLRVIKSVPYCVEAAKENARLWRWKPALKDGKPVEALGIITVSFDIFSQRSSRS